MSPAGSGREVAPWKFVLLCEPESEAALLPSGAGQVVPARTVRNLLLRFAGQETYVLLEPQGCLKLLDTGWQQIKYLTLRPKVLSIFGLIRRL